MQKVPLLGCMILAVHSMLAYQTDAAVSAIWGQNGEKWDKQRIQDFTHAGYRDGTVPIPVFPIKVNVKDMGAKGDGIQDDTKPIRQALKQCSDKAGVLFPAGVYKISDTLQVMQSGCAILGEGQGKTTLFFTRGLEELYPKYNGSQSSWSWSGGVILFSGSISDVGIQDLTILFPDSAWAGHNFHERGYNGIDFGGGVSQGWVKSVTITGSDLGLFVAGSHITLDHWILDFGPKRNAPQHQGHHGTNVSGQYNMFSNFRIEGLYQHDLSVEGTPMYNVFMQGYGKDLCFDHHSSQGYDQKYNLFTEIDIGAGNRMYTSGGNRIPAGVSFNETWWNIKSAKPVPWITTMGTSKNNVEIGINASGKSALPDTLGNWLEAIQSQDIQPQNLYWAQMKLLHGIDGGSMGSALRNPLEKSRRNLDPEATDAVAYDVLGKTTATGGHRGYPVYSLARKRSRGVR